jgi:5-methylcytosine-specific restriction enzyme B
MVFFHISFLNLTMGLFWIRPETFLNLDQTNRSYLKIKLPPKGLTAKFYIDTLCEVSKKGKPFPDLSLDAYYAREETPPGQGDPVGEDKINYWLVGAFWDDNDPPDQTERFIRIRLSAAPWRG